MIEENIARSFLKANSKFIRYICVGLMNTLFGYSIFSLLIYLGVHHTSAVILSAIVSIIFNFKTLSHIVFNNCDNKLICRFLLVYVLIATLNIVLLDCELKLKINIYMAGAILLMPLGLLSFVLNNKLVFKESYEEN